MPHAVLLGDSIFDNGRYTLGEPDGISHVCRLLPTGWKASLLAVDGSTTTDIPVQLTRLPSDASHLVFSVGGNNAIMNAGILNAPVTSSSQALTALGQASRTFEEDYRRAVTACRQMRLPLTLCTIYNGCFPDADYQRLISTALMVFNDVILRVAIEFRLTAIDLRFVCSSNADSANALEPSAVGSAKIARAIVNLVSAHQVDDTAAKIFAAD